MFPVLGDALYNCKLSIPFGLSLLWELLVQWMSYMNNILNFKCTCNHSKALFMELIRSLHWWFDMWFKELCQFSVLFCFWRSYLISASGLGLADSVNIWLLRNSKAQAHHLASPPPHSTSDHFLCSMPPDYWLVPILMPVLTLFPLPPCTFSAILDQCPLLEWSRPWLSQQSLFPLHISMQVSVRVLCTGCCPSCWDVSLHSRPLSSSREGRLAAPFVAVLRNSGDGGAVQNTKLPSLGSSIYFAFTWFL